MTGTSLAAAADRVAKLPRSIVVNGAKRFDEIARDTASRAVGGTLQLHGRGGRRPVVKLKTYYRIADLGAETRAYVRPKPAGVWRWLEDGTRQHQIGARTTRTGRARRTAKFLKGASYDHPIRAPIIHPGARGQHVWTKAKRIYNGEAHTFAARELKKVIRG